ncbi:MAG: hypothetical protein EZS28_023931 [Streblomastix strix]|uniref:Uncharacterized protein n=1 Tax=Streblomastix strix TaxID=222440 RepID=A0A5J4VDG8_9EUKA|nr:MAG: hypothetical protein EZS28_023931 [Streblomastix strix]
MLEKTMNFAQTLTIVILIILFISSCIPNREGLITSLLVVRVTVIIQLLLAITIPTQRTEDRNKQYMVRSARGEKINYSDIDAQRERSRTQQFLSKQAGEKQTKNRDFDEILEKYKSILTGRYLIEAADFVRNSYISIIISAIVLIYYYVAAYNQTDPLIIHRYQTVMVNILVVAQLFLFIQSTYLIHPIFHIKKNESDSNNDDEDISSIV